MKKVMTKCDNGPSLRVIFQLENHEFSELSHQDCLLWMEEFHKKNQKATLCRTVKDSDGK